MAQILCVNEYTLHRLFYFITNISLSDYIRKRRLSSSCNDLLKGSKVIDVALKYGYESSTAFGRSFKRMMGFNPKDISKNKENLKILPVLNFEKYNKKYEEINYSVIENISFNLYGISKTVPIETISQIVSHFWNEMLKNKNFRFDDKRYGIVEYDNILDTPKIATYYIASAYNFKGSKNYKINNKSFLKFSIEDRNAENISNFTKMIYACVIPYLGFNLDTIPDIEEYVGETTTNIYIPIKK